MSNPALEVFNRMLKRYFDEAHMENDTVKKWHTTIFNHDRCRYTFDQVFTNKNGWMQYDTDQDAWYFGVWVCKSLRVVWTYAEGDISVEQFKTDEDFNKNIDHMNEFYEAGYIAKVYGEEGCTKFVQDRETFKIGGESNVLTTTESY